MSSWNQLTAFCNQLKARQRSSFLAGVMKFLKIVLFLRRRNGRVVECGGLENRWPFTRPGGSNPSFSAVQKKPDNGLFFIGGRRDKTCFRSDSTNKKKNTPQVCFF